MQKRVKHTLEVTPPGSRILLHACCAPCSSAIVECLVNHGIRPTIFYSNSNIFPESEYGKRLNECTSSMIAMTMDIGITPYMVLSMNLNVAPAA